MGRFLFVMLFFSSLFVELYSSSLGNSELTQPQNAEEQQIGFDSIKSAIKHSTKVQHVIIHRSSSSSSSSSGGGGGRSSSSSGGKTSSSGGKTSSSGGKTPSSGGKAKSSGADSDSSGNTGITPSTVIVAGNGGNSHTQNFRRSGATRCNQAGSYVLTVAAMASLLHGFIAF